MSFIYKYQASTLTPFVKPRTILNLAIQNIFYIQSGLRTIRIYIQSGANRKRGNAAGSKGMSMQREYMKSCYKIIKNWGIFGLFLFIFGPFIPNQCPSSIWHRDSNSRPPDYESSPLTTDFLYNSVFLGVAKAGPKEQCPSLCAATISMYINLN